MDKNIYFFEATFGFEYDGKWTEQKNYGFVHGKTFVEATAQVNEYYGDELLKVTIECIGDSSLLCVDNEKVANEFKKAHLSCLYGEEVE